MISAPCCGFVMVMVVVVAEGKYQSWAGNASRCVRFSLSLSLSLCVCMRRLCVRVCTKVAPIQPHPASH